MIGEKIYKNKNDLKRYTETANWCNANGAYIVDQGDYYEVLPVNHSDKEKAQIEIISLKDFLSNTDYTVIKCYELGLEMSEEYPEVYKKRVEARKRINELESLFINEEQK